MKDKKELRRIVDEIAAQAKAAGMKATIVDLGEAPLVAPNRLAKCNCISCRMARTIEREMARRN